MKQLQQNHQSCHKSIVAAFELSAIPVALDKKQGYITDDLISCMQTILQKSHPAYDFAVEILYLGDTTSKRINSSKCRIIFTVFAYGTARCGRNLLDMLRKRSNLLKITLKRYNYTIKELQPFELGEIHTRLQTFHYKNILAPKCGVADGGHSVCALAVDIPANTAVSLLFTRDLNSGFCRVTSEVMTQTEEALIWVKPHFQSWPLLKIYNKKGEYLQKRLEDAAMLNKLSQLVCKTIPWNSSARLLELPVGYSYGIPCAVPSAIGVQFPNGMLNSMSQDTVHVGSTGKVEISLTKEQLSRHCCILGQTGSGKTNLLCELIQNCDKANMKVVVFDLAGGMDFRGVIKAIHGEIYTLHDHTSPFAINPLKVADFSPGEVKKILSDFFEKELGLFEPLPRLVKNIFTKLPEKKNYTVSEFCLTFMKIFDENLGYSGDSKVNLRSAMEVRLQSFANLFGDARHPFVPADFFRTNHLLELHQCTEMERTILLAFILQVLIKYVQKLRSKGISYPPLIVIIDEVHTMLYSNETDESRAALLRMFRNLLAEGRKLKLWIVLADQRLDLLKSLLEEVGTKFVMRTDTACGDLARLLREPYAESHLPVLEPGELYLRAPDMNMAVFLRVPPVSTKQVLSDKVVHAYMKKRGKLRPEPLPVHTAITVPQGETKNVLPENEARRIAYHDVLIKVVEYFYSVPKEERNRLVGGFRLEEYLQNIPCHVTDPKVVSAVKSYLKDVVQNLQFLAQ